MDLTNSPKLREHFPQATQVPGSDPYQVGLDPLKLRAQVFSGQDRTCQCFRSDVSRTFVYLKKSLRFGVASTHAAGASHEGLGPGRAVIAIVGITHVCVGTVSQGGRFGSLLRMHSEVVRQEANPIVSCKKLGNHHKNNIQVETVR